MVEYHGLPLDSFSEITTLQKRRDGGQLRREDKRGGEHAGIYRVLAERERVIQ